jgi:hypothetical protein
LGGLLSGGSGFGGWCCQPGCAHINSASRRVGRRKAPCSMLLKTPRCIATLILQLWPARAEIARA